MDNGEEFKEEPKFKEGVTTYETSDLAPKDEDKEPGEEAVNFEEAIVESPEKREEYPEVSEEELGALGEIKLSPEQTLGLLVAHDKREDKRENKGYIFTGEDGDFYLFSLPAEGGAGTSFRVDKFTGDIYIMDELVGNVFDEEEVEAE